MKRLFAIALLALSAVPAAHAEDDTAKLKQTLRDVIPHVQPDSVVASPINGLYEVTYGSTLVYVTADGRYLIQGDMLDVKDKRNLTEAHRAERRKEMLSDLGEDKLIIFKPEQPTHAVTVFTDIDCGYCRKFHQEIADFNKLGIEVRYAAFPRAGIGSPSFNKAVSVWCADDRNKAITQAKAGGNVDEKTCDNPVAAEYALGQQLGVTGTPTIILEDGTLVPGYVPAARLKQMLDQVAG